MAAIRLRLPAAFVGTGCTAAAAAAKGNHCRGIFRAWSRPSCQSTNITLGNSCSHQISATGSGLDAPVPLRALSAVPQAAAAAAAPHPIRCMLALRRVSLNFSARPVSEQCG